MNLNSKLRSDSVFAQLNNEQLETLEDWLFEDKLGYKDVLARAKAEWNVNTSATSLGRFYRRLALQREEERRLETVALCLESLAAKNDGTLQAGLLALANQCAIEFLVEQPKSIREFAGMLRALTSAGLFEMKHLEFQRSEKGRRQAEIGQKKNEAQEREIEEMSREANAAYWKRREEKQRVKAAEKAALKPEPQLAAGLTAAEPRNESREEGGEVVNIVPLPNDHGATEKSKAQPEDGTSRSEKDAEKPLKTH